MSLLSQRNTKMNFPKKSYMICTQQRSGSWLLAEGLEGTRVAGRPREYFNELTEGKFFKEWSVSTYGDYLPKIRAMATSPNGVFGIKVHWCQFDPMIDKLKTVSALQHASTQAVLDKIFPELSFVWLSRRDRVRQAISHFRAIQTGQWWKIGPANGDSSASPMMLDCAAVLKLEQFAVNNDREWERLLSALGVTPLRIYYEDLAARYDSTIAEVLNWLGVSSQASAIRQPRLIKQADEMSDKWVEEYTNYKQSLSHAQPAPVPA